MQLSRLGVPSERIVFANPMKFPSHIEYAKKLGIAMMTVDHEDELKKIKDIYPEAKYFQTVKITHLFFSRTSELQLIYAANMSIISLRDKFIHALAPICLHCDFI